jgi:D-amino-acid oxidase
LSFLVLECCSRLRPQLDTVRHLAGRDQAAPSLVNHNNTQQFARILRRSYSTHAQKGQVFGVSARQNFTLLRASNFESCPKDVIPPPHKFRHLPFARLRSPGYSYSTLLVEPPIFLAKLFDDLIKANVTMTCREFVDLSEVVGMQETIVINCTGLGSKIICRDQMFTRSRGN